MKAPLTELQERVLNFQERLRKKGIEGALLVQRADTLYYSGTAQNVHVYIPRDGSPLVMAYRDFLRAQAESWTRYFYCTSVWCINGSDSVR
ncbi:MAG TPA: aminopeptidase P family N-terminal domain-containing protein [Desulfosporosinus sp.]|nr:aminopeptidase P family N-terminal domain-containing protein [Desulfosporosinus sp.]